MSLISIDNVIKLVITLIAAIGVLYFKSGSWKDLSTLLLGAMITYDVQSFLQDREKNRVLRINQIEEIYSPIYLEIKSIRENLLEYPSFPKSGVWDQLKDSTKMFALDNKFKNQINDFYDRVSELWMDVYNSRTYTKETMNKVFSSMFLIDIGHKLGSWDTLVDDAYDGVGVSIDYPKKLRQGYVRLVNELLFQIDPFELESKNNENFSIDDCIIHYRINSPITEGFQPRPEKFSTFPHSIPLKEHKSTFLKYLDNVQNEISKNEVIKRIRIESKELIPIAKNLEEKLLNHITKYYPKDEIK